MNTQKLLIAGIVGLFLILVVSQFRAINVNVEVPKSENFQAGAVPTLDGVDFPIMTVNGVGTAYRTVGLTATSSTICSIQNPFQATSTVTSYSLNVRTGMLGANAFSVSTSTNTYGTSTQSIILDRNLASLVGDTVGWNSPQATTTNPRVVSSNGNGETTFILTPGQYLNTRLATTTGAGALAAYYVGTCSATFRKF